MYQANFMNRAKLLSMAALFFISQLTFVVTSASSQTLTISDNFTNLSPFRDPGDPLNGTRTEVGNRPWTANPQVVFGYNYVTVANPATDVSYNGGFPFTIPANMPIASVEAVVDVRGSNWISVGFTLSATGGHWAHGQIITLLHPTGQVEVFANGTQSPGSRLIAIPAPVFYANGYNKLKVEYDSESKTVSAWINNTIILDRHVLNIPGFMPNIQYAGFHIWNDSNASTPPLMKIDSYTVAARANVDTQPPLVWVDDPVQNQTISGKYPISGWATDASGVHTIRFEVDDLDISLREDLNVRIPRPDVCQAYGYLNDPNCPNVGWKGTLDTRAFSDGLHKLTIVATDNKGNQKRYDHWFKVSNPDLKDTIILDSFTILEPNRYPGKPLNGTFTEKGGQKWTAHPWIVFGQGANVTNNPGTASGSYVAGVPFTPNPNKPVARIEADVRVYGSKWVAIGFSKSATGGYWGHGQVWMIIGSNGYADVLAKGLDHNLLSQSAPVPNFDLLGFNKMVLEYNSAYNTVSAWVNGGQILANFDLNSLGFTPTITHAGFHMWNDDTGKQLAMKVDYFAVAQTAEIVIPPYLVLEKPTENETISGKYDMRGWTTHPSGVDDLDFFMDSTDVCFRNENHKGYRPDVCEDHTDPGCPDVGFIGTFNSRGLADGEHELTVIATSNQGSQATVVRKFNVSNPDLADTKVVDTFTYHGKPGQPLNGNKTEKGDVIWEAHNSVVYGCGRITNHDGGAGGSHIGGVRFTSDPNRPLATVSAEVEVYASEWIGIGFSKSATGGYWSHGRVWMLLRPNGVVTVFADGVNHVLHQQTISNLSPAINTLAIALNESDKTVSAWVNDIKILDSYDLKQLPPFDLGITYTGFHMYNSDQSLKGLMEIRYFSVGASKAENTPLCITDGFTNQSPLRDAGDPLHGTFTETGNLQWNANPWVVFGANVITNTGTSNSHIGGVPFNPNDYPGRPVISVEAMVKVVGSEWIGLGFASDAQGGYWAIGQTWFLLKKSGQLEIWADGTKQYLGGPFAPVFYANGFNHMRLELDTQQNTFSVWVNNVKLLDRYDLDLRGFKPNITHAGFHMFNGNLQTQGQMKIDDFKVCAQAVGSSASSLTELDAGSETSAANNTNELSETPIEYSLEQNYPNPFNPSTTIRYGLPKAGHVTLKLYNLQGQLVRTLVDGNQSAGQRVVSWDGKNQSGQQVPSGTYLYRLVTSEYSQTKRMVLMK